MTAERDEWLDEPVHGTPNNLPAQLTAFIGRERELEELRALVASSRLLTLNGTGGCGKTRLAQRLAGDVIDDYAGVWLVELATVVDPDRVPAAVAQALGELDLTGDLVEVIVARLADCDTLVILDNCEHLLEPIAQLVDALLRRCPRLTITATSREPLGVPGEVAWRVPSMAVPHSLDDLRTDAIRLFVERAERARPNFRLTDENASQVAQICRRLDGIPLAIELAAARMRGMTVDQVAGALDDRFRLLTGGARTVLPRQQTLQASVDWGYDLLTEQERAVFRRLSVFAGGFTLDAAEAVVAGDPVDAVEVLGLLLALVDKSFVVAADDSGRYSMLETLRQYGAARLFEAGETELVRDRHLAWASGLFDAVRVRITGSFDPIAEAPEIDNLRAAFEWAVTTENADAACTLASTIMGWEGDLGDAAEAVRTGRRAFDLPEGQLRLRLLVGAILVWAYFEISDHASAAAMCDDVRERLEDLDEDDVIRVTCLRMSTFAVQRYEPDVLHDALNLAERVGEADAAATCASIISVGAAWRGDVSTARAFAARCSDRPGTVSGQNLLIGRAQVATMTGRFDEARAALDEADATYFDRHPRLVAFREAQRVFLDLAQGIDTGAAVRVAGLLDDARRRRFLSGVASAGWAPGAWALAHGDFVVALRDLLAWRGDAASSALSLGRQWFGIIAHALLAAGRTEEAAAAVAQLRNQSAPWQGWGHDLTFARMTALEGIVARAVGDLSRSEQRVHEALALQHEGGWLPDLVHSIEALAGVASANESYAEAARLAAAAQRMRDEMGYVLRWPYEQQLLDADLGAARDVLGEDGFAAAWAEGLALGEDAAVAYAQRARGERKRPSVGWESLTPVEGEVVRLVAEGLTNKQVGDALFIGAETVKTHLSHVYDKLGVRSRTALATRFTERAESSALRP